MDIFKLVGSIFVDTEKANDSLKKTDEKGKNVGETLGKIGSTAAGVATAVVGAASAMVGGMVETTKKTAEASDEIDKASIRMGITAEQYQELAYAAGLAGVSTSNLESAAKKLEGTGINFDDAINQIMSLETAEERSAAAAELFGDKVAYTLSPLIEQSAEDFAAARQEANDLGLVMSSDVVKAGAEMNDTFSKIEQSGAMLQNKLGEALLPVMQEVADKILQYMPTIVGIIEKFSPVLTTMFDNMLPPLFDLADQLLPIIFDLIETILPVLGEIISAILPVIVKLMQEFLPIFMDLARVLLPLVVDLIKAIVPILPSIIDLLTPILKLLVSLLTPLVQLLDLILPPLISLMVYFADVALTPLKAILNLVGDSAKNLADQMVTAFKHMKDGLRTPINAILGFMNKMSAGTVGGVNNIIDSLNRLQIKVPSWVTKLTGVTNFGFNLSKLSVPQIPLLANGGEVEGTAIVGEDGPELLQTAGTKTRVTPLNDNNNAFVGMEEKLDRMIELLERGFGVYINGSAMVGQLAPDIDMALGRMSNNALRRV